MEYYTSGNFIYRNTGIQNGKFKHPYESRAYTFRFILNNAVFLFSEIFRLSIHNNAIAFVCRYFLV